MIKSRFSTMLGVALFVGLSGVVPAQRRSGQEPAADKGGKPRIVILGASSPEIRWTANVTTATLEDALSQSGRFEVVTGSQRDKLLSEQGFNNSDLVDPKQATQVGKLLSARYIVIGNALDVSASKKKVPHGFGSVLNRVGAYGGEEISSDVTAKVQIQMIDSQTGVVKLSKSYSEKVSKDQMAHSSSDYDTLREGYRKAMERVAAQFAKESGMSLPIQGLVVFIRGERVAIDVGGDQSAQVGQQFEVYSEDQPIKNAAGEILSYVTNKYALLRIVAVEPKLSWTQVVETYDDNSNRDPQPKLERIKLNYAVRQVQ
ncbi:MAG TPA: CsgG/HfaB family protein [Blastocatellia bacterium]|nr:CsgG/HfaB family protein [Blastocatellia bacterium]